MNLYFLFHDNSIPELLKPVAVKADYFEPIQKSLDNHKEATSSTMLLSEHSNLNTEQQTSSSSSSLKKKNNRKRTRTSDTTATLSSVTKSSSSDKESDLYTASKKKRRSFQKSSRRLNREVAVSADIPTTTKTNRSAFETDFNIQISSFTENTYIPVMRKEELMGRYFESLVNDPAEPVPYEPAVTDDAVFQVSMFEVPDPESDDYLESLQKRFCFDN